MPCGCLSLVYAGLAILDGVPRTIGIEMYSWQNTSWGFHAIDRNYETCTIAVSSDNSRATSCRTKSFKHYLMPTGNWRFDALYLASEHAAYRIDHDTREISGGRCRCTWTWKLITGDTDCSETARRESESAQRIGRGHIAGYEVIRYREQDESGYVREFALAPAASCEVMEWTVKYPGTMGIPGARRHYRVTSYVAGEPDRRLFVLPANYTRN